MSRSWRGNGSGSACSPAGLIIGKGAVIVILTRMAGYELPVAFRTGLVLGQAGEFGFAVLVVAISNELLSLQEDPAGHRRGAAEHDPEPGIDPL